MIELSNVKLPLDAGLLEGQGLLRAAAAKAAGVGKNQIVDVRILKRSVDARKKNDVHFVTTLGVTLANPKDEARIARKESPTRGVNCKLHVPYEPLAIPDCRPDGRNGIHEPRPVVVGTGPAGLFAALCLAKAGLKPLVIERGGCIEKRVDAVDTFFAGGAFDSSTNIQFGEGGAGTFSDGKLTTNVKNPLTKHILRWFVDAGAPEDILVLAKPHIGTDELRRVVRTLRDQIESLGATVLFDTQLTGFIFSEGSLEAIRVRSTHDVCALLRDVDLTRERGVDVVDVDDVDDVFDVDDVDDAQTSCDPSEKGESGGQNATRDIAPNARTSGLYEFVIPATRVVLACGHSARDTFELVRDTGLYMERKPFSMGVRIEHKQEAINRAQYGKFASHPALGAADYKLAVHLPNGRGVYTFCMCPGGVVVPAASEEGSVCVNGMSYHARAGENANAAVLVGVDPEDFPGPSNDVLAGVELQRQYERAAFELAQKNAGNNTATYLAPAQTVGDFLSGKQGRASAEVTPSYARGVSWSDLHECLPDFVSQSLEEAIVLMDKKLRGFANPEAVMTGIETRSSSPVRIVRDESLQAIFKPDLVFDDRGNARSRAVVSTGIYPCGEGAGYAGGIMSAAVDGLRVALAICNRDDGFSSKSRY